MAGQAEAARPESVKGTRPELVEVGIAQMRQGMAAWQATGTGMQRSHLLALLAEAYASAGQTEEGLNVLVEALAFVQSSNERYCEADLHRLKGDLLLMQGGDEAEAKAGLHQAESCFLHAIEVARRQQAKSWELRATVSLARLWQ